MLRVGGVYARRYISVSAMRYISLRLIGISFKIKQINYQPAFLICFDFNSGQLTCSLFQT
jgi:hypothetical protein